MKAKKVADRGAGAGRRARRHRPGAAAAARRRQPSNVADPRQGRRTPRPPWSTCSSSWGCWRDDPGPGGDRRLAGGIEVSREAVTFARDLPAEAGGGVPVDAVVVGDGARRRVPTSSAAYGVRDRAPRRRRRRSRRYGGAAWAAAVAGRPGGGRARRGDWPRARRAATRCWPTSPPGSGVAMAANVLSFGGLAPVRGHPPGGGRCGAGGDGARRAARPCSPSPGTRSRPQPAPAPGRRRRCVEFTPEVSEADLVARVVVERGAGAGPVRRPEARPGSSSAPAAAPAGADGFGDLLELAELLGGALGVSRVVTSLGWRPHHEQVGQTGSRISPDALHPVRDQRRDPALGGLLARPRPSSRSTPTPTRRWSPRRRTP